MLYFYTFMKNKKTTEKEILQKLNVSDYKK